MRSVKTEMAMANGLERDAAEMLGSRGSWEAIFLGGPSAPQHGSMPREPETVAPSNNISAHDPTAENVESPQSQASGRVFGSRGARVRPTKNGSMPIPARILPHMENLWASLIVGADSASFVVLISGPTGNEGASVTSFYTAVYAALRHGLRTVYIDLDDQKMPKFYRQHSDSAIGGFAGFCLDGHSMESISRSTEYENLFIIPSGAPQGISLSTIVSQKARLEAFFQEVRRAYDVAVIDGPPVLKELGILSVARLVDHVILACRYGQTRYEVAGLAARKLQEIGVKRLSAILTCREYPIPMPIYRWLK